MNIADFSNIESFMLFLEAHTHLAYFILFLGSMVETVIGLSFIFFGEIFFITGGMLASSGKLDIVKVVIVLYLGGILGDNISYFIGRKFGDQFYFKFSNYPVFRKVLNKKNYDRGVSYFNRVGPISVFLARFMGPVSWITPFISGVHHMEYKKFVVYNFFGVILGIGVIILAGYLGGSYLEVFIK